MLPASSLARSLAASLLASLALLAGSGAAAAAGTAAEGYVTPPYWAAYTRDGIATLSYARVASSSLGSAGGPQGTKTQVPVGVRLVSATGATLRSLIAVPRGYVILSVAGSAEGVVVTAGPLADLAGAAAPSSRPWLVIASALQGGQSVAWRYTPGHGVEAPPDVSAAGTHWAAVTQFGRAAKVPSEAVLAEGSFGSSAGARVYTARADVLPMAVAVEPSGQVGLYDLEYAATRLSTPRFASAARVALVWSGRGVLVPAPGGFLTVEGTAVARPEAGGRSTLIGNLPKGASVVSVSGDGETVVLLLASRKGALSTWAIGPAPKSLHTVLAIRPSEVFLTTAGLVGLTLHLKGRIVTVTFAAAQGS